LGWVKPGAPAVPVTGPDGTVKDDWPATKWTPVEDAVCVIWTVAVALVKPVAEAVMTALVPAKAPAVTGKVVVFVPCRTETLEGTETAEGLLLESITTSPFAGAGAPRVIVINAVFVVTRLRGLGVKRMLVAPGAIAMA
jgi:hypothetical protein